MGLDFTRARKAQQKLQNKGKTFEKIDYTKIYFKPAEGEQVVRIVPFKEDRGWPIIEVELHNYDTFKNNIPSLRNFEEKDPIVEFRKKVYEKGSEDEKEEVKKIAPSIKRFVQVIVRGQEGLGVRLWELKSSYQLLVNILNKEEHYGDITDVVEGRDLILDAISETKAIRGKSVTYVKVSGITPSGKASPLSKDANQVEEWLEKQYIPIEQYKKYTYDEIQQILENYLTPDDVEDGEEATAPEPTPAAKAVATLKAKPAAAPAKKVAAPVVVAQEAEEIEAEEITGEDELSDVIPNVAPTPAPAKKAPAKAPAKPAATSFTKSFKSMFDDEDEA